MNVIGSHISGFPLILLQRYSSKALSSHVTEHKKKRMLTP